MDSDTVIRATGLGKCYTIGHRAELGGTLRDAIVRTAGALARSTGAMLRGRPLIAGDELEQFWALRDVNFEVKRGEVLGIIGRNGAGKSTLLKLLSRITEPSEGRIEIRGRVASLLEIGTGFHPELTGRENVFLNGAILGMTRAEIRRKFDEIVAFAGVEKFLDTPVKRFSSGMYVRLAFAVAAHLEPEILIVDEVLAVGDAEFQKKCLGKMQDVAGQGRTVLFVSHNLASVQALCRVGLYLDRGAVKAVGTMRQVIGRYLSEDRSNDLPSDLAALRSKGNKGIVFRGVEYRDDCGRVLDAPTTGEPVNIALRFAGRAMARGPSRIGIEFTDRMGHVLFLCANEAAHKDEISIGPDSVVVCRIPSFPLTAGTYGLGLFLEVNGVIEHWIEDPITVRVNEGSFYDTSRDVPNGHDGLYTLVPNSWSVVS